MRPATAKRLLPLAICLCAASLWLNVFLFDHVWSCLAHRLGIGDVERGGDALDVATSDDWYLGGRRLTTANASGTSASQATASHGQHHSHSQDALLFLFNAIIFGVILLQMGTFPKLHHMQQTVALFVVGIFYSLVQEGLTFNKHAGVLGSSYDMWMHIDPHLMLFTMLPALLAGDAMTLDTNVVKRVAGQCMYLAGPGVVINILLAAGFFRLYFSQYNWPFELCLTTGSIVAATDPVAVVNLLKQLGAAPSLTILIQGESLLNDGTAIVCFVLAYDMLQGESYEFGDVVVFIVRKAICACGLGWVIGWLFVVWISAASDRFEHCSGMIQVCLTLCCAYWSFIMAEGVMGMSGVLCTVSASLVLADNMWPSIVDKAVLLHVWHVIEFLGNTMIFFLAGALTGNSMVYIPAHDYLHLFVIYIVLTIIRGSVIIGSLPILRKLGNATLPLSEAIVMTWGGLRGAVGLALAIQVSIEKAGGKVSVMNSRRVLFYTGGLAFLTLVVNAVTCPSLVKFLGLVQTDAVKRKLLLRVCRQMVQRVHLDSLKTSVRTAVEEMIQRIDDTVAAIYNVELNARTQSHYTSEVGRHSKAVPFGDVNSSSKGASPDYEQYELDDGDSMTEEGPGEQWKVSSTLIGEVAEWDADPETEIDVNRVLSKDSSRRETLNRSECTSGEPSGAVLSRAHSATTVDYVSERVFKLKEKIRVNLAQKIIYDDGQTMLDDFEVALRKMERIPATIIGLLNVPAAKDLVVPEGVMAIMTKSQPDPQVMELVNAALLSLVQSNYWKMIEDGEFIEGSSHPAVLLNSATWAMQAKTARLGDFEHLFTEMGLRKRRSPLALEDRDGDYGHDVSLSLKPSSWAISTGVRQVAALHGASADTNDSNEKVFRLQQIIESTYFSSFITTAIVLNVIMIFIEESNRKGNSDYAAWLAIEICFNVIFCTEFGLKFAHLGRQYFLDAWQCFDSLLLVSGFFGIIVEIVWKTDEADVSSKARAFRVNRIFRALRLIRVFRLVQLLGILRARWSGLEMSMQLAKNMRTVTVLTAFARAHVQAEKGLEKFFGNSMGFPGCEMAQCIVDSRTAVCEAICVAAFEIGKLEIVILERLEALRESGQITEDLSQFISEAAKMGTMNAKEMENLLQPLREQQQQWYNEEKHHLAGIYDRQQAAVFAATSTFRDASTANRRGSLRVAMANVQNPWLTSKRHISIASSDEGAIRRYSFSSASSKPDGEPPQLDP